MAGCWASKDEISKRRRQFLKRWTGGQWDPKAVRELGVRGARGDSLSVSFHKMSYSREFWRQWVSRNLVATIEVGPLLRSPQYQQ